MTVFLGSFALKLICCLHPLGVPTHLPYPSNLQRTLLEVTPQLFVTHSILITVHADIGGYGVNGYHVLCMIPSGNQVNRAKTHHVL